MERLDPRQHAQQLFDADKLDSRGESWTYLPYGPFADLAGYRRWVAEMCRDTEMVAYAIVSTDPAAAGPEHSAVGVLSLLRMQPEMGVTEVGHVHYSHDCNTPDPPRNGSDSTMRACFARTRSSRVATATPPGTP